MEKNLKTQETPKDERQESSHTPMSEEEKAANQAKQIAYSKSRDKHFKKVHGRGYLTKPEQKPGRPR